MIPLFEERVKSPDPGHIGGKSWRLFVLDRLHRCPSTELLLIQKSTELTDEGHKEFRS